MAPTKPQTRIALLADVHGNLPALEAVLADAQKRGFDQVWHLGDFLGYVPFPNEVIATLRLARATCVIGNYDLKVLSFTRKQARWARSKMRVKYEAFGWNHAHLKPATRKYLEGLPHRRLVKRHGQRILLTHGSPASIREHLTPDSNPERLRDLAVQENVQIITCGHSHAAFKRRIGRTWFINPGSVGRPEGGDWRSAYSLLTITTNKIKMCKRRVPYDLERAGRAIHAAGLDQALFDALREGRPVQPDE